MQELDPDGIQGTDQVYRKKGRQCNLIEHPYSEPQRVNLTSYFSNSLLVRGEKWIQMENKRLSVSSKKILRNQVIALVMMKLCVWGYNGQKERA